MELKHRKIIANIAFKIFRAWTKNATKFHPDMNFTIVDETGLVNDLEATILKGIKTLQKEEKKESRKQKGFDYGFLVGFIQGNLDVKWIHEYIQKNTELYRNFIACKAILEYLRFNTQIGSQMDNVYIGLMKQDSNLAEINTAINEKLIEKYQIDKASKEKQYVEKNKPVYMYLENQLSKHVLEVTDSNKYDIMPKLDTYFEQNFITELIFVYEDQCLKK